MSNPTMKYLIELDNLCLISTRQVTKGLFEHAFVSRNISELKLCSHNRSSQIFPLFVSVNGKRELNIKPKFLASFNSLYETQVNIEQKGIDIFNYIYGILYSNWYRINYSVFLKSEFPRIPCPKNADIYFKLVSLGKELVKLHLLEFDFPSISFPNLQDRVVSEIKLKENNVFINKSTSIASVPNQVWNFGIGGYKPVQKWLKSYKGKELTDEDINHYRKIIVALTETNRIMKAIDKIDFMSSNEDSITPYDINENDSDLSMAAEP
jgi:predicted helicase